MVLTPPDETVRLVALGATGLLGTPDDYALRCSTNIGAQLFNVPMCFMVLADSQPSPCVGLDDATAAAMSSLCEHVVRSGESIVVEDALRDDPYRDTPRSLSITKVRFYAGYPIRDASGAALGTLCLVDFKPKEFPPAQLTLLQELASLTELSIFARRVSTAQKALAAKLDVARRESLLDPLLRIWNRGGITTILDQQHKISFADHASFSILMIDIDRFKRINDRHGHHVGDIVLKAITHALRGSVRPDDELGRYGGEEFLAVLPNTTAENAQRLARHLNKSIAELRVETPTRAIGCTVSIGVAEWAPIRPESAQALVNRADSALLSAKQGGRDRVLLSERTSDRYG